MSLTQVVDEKPVKWYIFYSEKQGRDYYYEPISRVVTWIRPDDLHSHPSSVPSQVIQVNNNAASVERRVSFHASVNDENDTAQQQDRGIKNAPKQGNEIASIGSSPTRIPILLLLMGICILVVTASYMEWLPRGPLGSAFFGGKHETFGAGDGIPKMTRDAQDEQHSQQTRNKMEKESSARGLDTERRHSRHESTTTRRHTHSEQHLDCSSSSHSQTDFYTKPNEKRGNKKEDGKLESEPTRLHDASARQERREEMHSEDSSSSEDVIHAHPPRNKGCMVPFAHVFSKKCRTVLTQQPVYDMDALLDSLI